MFYDNALTYWLRKISQATTACLDSMEELSIFFPFFHKLTAVLLDLPGVNLIQQKCEEKSSLFWRTEASFGGIGADLSFGGSSETDPKLQEKRTRASHRSYVKKCLKSTLNIDGVATILCGGI